MYVFGLLILEIIFKTIETIESIQYDVRDIISLIENDILDNPIFLKI